jgi:hypothetical protein
MAKLDEAIHTAVIHDKSAAHFVLTTMRIGIEEYHALSRIAPCTQFESLVTGKLPDLSCPMRIPVQQQPHEHSDAAIVDRHLQEGFYNTR